jgi:hypothetical protein
MLQLHRPQTQKVAGLPAPMKFIDQDRSISQQTVEKKSEART